MAACHEKVADGLKQKNTATRDAACMRLILTGTSRKNKVPTASSLCGALAGSRHASRWSGSLLAVRWRRACSLRPRATPPRPHPRSPPPRSPHSRAQSQGGFTVPAAAAFPAGISSENARSRGQSSHSSCRYGPRPAEPCWSASTCSQCVSGGSWSTHIDQLVRHCAFAHLDI